MFLNVAAAIITVLVLLAILKRVEVRLALLTGGLLLAAVSWNLQAFSEAFAKSMTTAGLISVILPVMGFAAVMELTGCDRHLVRLVTDPLLLVRPLLVPGAVLATFLINIAIPSAAGCAAAVGIVLIPAMIAAGVHPAMAAAALLAGTWGSVFNPGLMHNPVIAKIANVPVMDVILGHRYASVAGILVVAVLLCIEAKLFRQDRDWTPERAGLDVSRPAEKPAPPIERVSLVRAFVPVLPLALLLLTVPQAGLTTRWLPKGLTVLEAMVIGAMVGMLVTWTRPSKITTYFFDGMGRAYALVLGIIIAAGVFIGGLEAAGVVKSLIETLKATKAAVPFIGTFGPMLLTVVVGSGDAVTVAFNNAVTPHAAQFGMTPVNLGSLAMLGGALGRSMSPVAAAAIIVAGLARVNPIELTKRNAIPMLAAALAVFLILGR
jgi:DcuC family C4-dicarboxylate transporter